MKSQHHLKMFQKSSVPESSMSVTRRHNIMPVEGGKKGGVREGGMKEGRKEGGRKEGRKEET